MRKILVIMNRQSVKKKKERAQNEVIYYKTHGTRSRLNLTLVSTPTEMELKKKRIYLFQLEVNYFIILWWFLPYTDMNQPQVYVCLPSRTPLPPPSPSHPSGLSQCTGFEGPVLCIKLGLVIYFTYDNIQVSMLFSQIVTSSPSPTEPKSLFFISVSLLLSHIYGHHCHLSKFHIYVLIYCIGVFLYGLLHSV